MGAGKGVFKAGTPPSGKAGDGTGAQDLRFRVQPDYEVPASFQETALNLVPPTPPHRRSDVHIATGGEFAGWTTWTRDTFESQNGPFWHIEEHGRTRCAFRVEKKHLNGLGHVHGGCFMTFADYCLFAFARRELNGPGLTVAFNSEFLGGAQEGERIEATGEVTRAGGSLIFVRGMMHSAERPLLNFSGTIKRIKQRV